MEDLLPGDGLLYGMLLLELLLLDLELLLPVFLLIGLAHNDPPF